VALPEPDPLGDEAGFPLGAQHGIGKLGRPPDGAHELLRGRR
jgi:hypothetical protein